jgi:hypothetical protein
MALSAWAMAGVDMGGRHTAWDWRLIIASVLFCTLAFNLVFFGQELLLTLPKAFVPGVHVTLYHNNHKWTGDNPILSLLQGTGGLADLAMGLIFAVWLDRAGARSMTMRLFLFWMAIQGLYQGLSQLVIGAIVPGNDMGMAFGYLGLGAGTKRFIAVLGLTAMVAVGFWLARTAVRLLATTSESLSAGARMGFLFRIAMLPALVSGPLLIPFRTPRNMIELVIFPSLLMVFGAIWIWIGAGLSPATPRPARPSASLVIPLAALILLLLLFQLILRPGIAFS